jgi:hypothetical protein
VHNKNGTKLNMNESLPSNLTHLTNPLASVEQLSTSSSRLDGVPLELEQSVVYGGGRLIQAAGILLELPQDVIATAIIYFSRFWIGSEGGSLRQYAAKVDKADRCSRFNDSR